MKRGAIGSRRNWIESWRAKHVLNSAEAMRQRETLRDGRSSDGLTSRETLCGAAAAPLPNLLLDRRCNTIV
jgi:hypothetical protein